MKYTQSQLNDILENSDYGLIDFCCDDLSFLSFDGADLSGLRFDGAKLDGAKFCGTKLDFSSFGGASLVSSNFFEAKTNNTNLSGANLAGSNLLDANLDGAILKGANLSNTKLWGCMGNSQQIMTILIFTGYPITYTSDRLQIACKNHPISEWWEFDDKDILKMGGKMSLKFWRKNKDLIRQIVEQRPAQPTGHEGKETNQ